MRSNIIDRNESRSRLSRLMDKSSNRKLITWTLKDQLKRNQWLFTLTNRRRLYEGKVVNESRLQPTTSSHPSTQLLHIGWPRLATCYLAPVHITLDEGEVDPPLLRYHLPRVALARFLLEAADWQTTSSPASTLWVVCQSLNRNRHHYNINHRERLYNNNEIFIND